MAMDAKNYPLDADASSTKKGGVIMDGGIFNNGIQMPVQLQKVNEPVDWQHYRIQAAIAAMQGMIISDAYADMEISNQMTYEKSRIKWDNVKIAKAAVAHADALIAELQKKGGNNENT